MSTPDEHCPEGESPTKLLTESEIISTQDEEQSSSSSCLSRFRNVICCSRYIRGWCVWLRRGLYVTFLLILLFLSRGVNVLESVAQVGETLTVLQAAGGILLAAPTMKFPYPEMDPKCAPKHMHYYRTVDGTCNWLQKGSADLGKAGQPFGTDIAPKYGGDGTNDPREGPNAREVSNAFFRNTKTLDWGHTAYLSGFVQFLVHDLLHSVGGKEEADKTQIAIPMCDQHFDPNCTGTKVMHFRRNERMAGTGVEGKPRETINYQSIWLELATVYGENEEKMQRIRSHVDGKIILENEYLPINDERFQFDMRGHGHGSNDLFAAGDVRANQNFMLTTYHTLFAREHNRMCDVLKKKYPRRGWTDETLFLAARTVVAAKFSMVGFAYFNSYFVDMPFPNNPFNIYSQWTGDDPINWAFPLVEYPWKEVIDPFTGKPLPLPVEFSVGYRWHDLLPATLNDTEHKTMIDLIGTSFSAQKYKEYGFERIARSMASTSIPDFHSGVQDVYRNMKINLGDPRSETQYYDLAAWAVEHERERGVPTFNEWARGYPGKVPIKERKRFEDFTSNPEFVRELKRLYKTPDDVDLLVGQELDEEYWPHTKIPRSMLAISFYTLFKGSLADRFALLYQVGHCLVEQKPWDCTPNNFLQEILWQPILGGRLRWLDKYWLDEFDIVENGVNVLRNMVSQNSGVKCLQKNLFLKEDPITNPIICRSLADMPGPKISQELQILPRIKDWKPYSELVDQYGDLVHYRMMGQDFILLSSIDHLDLVYSDNYLKRLGGPLMGIMYGRIAGYKDDREVGGISNTMGADWARRRHIVDTVIKPQMLTKVLPLINKNARMLTDILTKKAPGVIDIKPITQQTYYEFMAEMAYGESFANSPQQIKDELHVAFRNFLDSFPHVFMRSSLNEHLDRTHAFQSALLQLKRTTRKYGNDFMGYLLSTPSGDGTYLKDEDIHGAIYDMITGGSSSGPFQLAYGLYLIATHPAVLSRVVNEISQVVGDATEVTYPMLHKLTYLSKVVREITRYQPGGGYIGGGRSNINDTNLGEYFLPADRKAVILFAVWKIHHDPRYYPNPDVFDPDRWDESSPAHRGETDLRYLTFGQGPMKCPGADTAHSHAIVSYVHLLRALNFEYIGLEPPRLKSLMCGEFVDSMELLTFPRG